MNPKGKSIGALIFFMIGLKRKRAFILIVIMLVGTGYFWRGGNFGSDYMYTPDLS